MANFGKYANLSKQGWTEDTSTQVMTTGTNAHIGLYGGGPKGETLIVKPVDPTVCAFHEEPANTKYPDWRHFLITALKEGETKVRATVPAGGDYSAPMTVKVKGKTGVRLIFFPGERMSGATTEGTIYVIGGEGESMKAAGGPPVGRYDRGGHTIDPTPPGQYVLGPKIHVVTQSWPTSVIAWGAALRINSDGEVEFEAQPGKWQLATGPKGKVTLAYVQFLKKDKVNPDPAVLAAQVRNIFIDPATKKLWTATWEKNDFGRWGWNLLQNGKPTAYFIHTTPEDEEATAQKKAVFLTNSHGCVHIPPADRDRLMKYLKQGTPFEVRPYTEKGTE